MTRMRSKLSTRTLIAVSVLCMAGGAHAGNSLAPFSIGLHESDCLVPGVIAWYSGNAISNGLAYNPCRNPIPLPAPTDPEPTTPVVIAEPPPPPRDPGPVPTYAPWTATAGPGSNAVGEGNGSSGYSNPYNVLAPSARAVVRKADFCNRNGRSQDVASACSRSVDGR